MKMLKPLTFMLGVMPLGYLVVQMLMFQSGKPSMLGADPGKEIVLFLGEWTIRILLLVLAISPLRQLSGWAAIMRIRRMVGLFAFFYATLHLTAYGVFLLELDPGRLGADLAKRPYIIAGFSAWLLLVPLALTSVDRAVRWLGKRWRTLHRLVYMVALLAVVHVFWLSKSGYAEALAYGLIVAFLVFYRGLRPARALFQNAINKPSN